MAKKRRPRVALGLITRADGVRVEVKSPTVWKLLNEQQQRIDGQQQVLESLQGTLAKLEAGNTHNRRWIDALDRNWWVRLGVRLGFVRLREVLPDSNRRPSLGDTKTVPPDAGPVAPPLPPRNEDAIPAT